LTAVLKSNTIVPGVNMVTGKKKEEIITFKVDETLARRLAAVPNRSDFIRRALLMALDNVCPLCQGTGVLTPDQYKHWEAFSRYHKVAECDNCHAYYLTCERA
jgi:hypothetical protein